MWKYWKGSEGNGVSITIVLLWEEVKEEKRRRGEEEKRRRGEEEKRKFIFSTYIENDNQ
ncbi:hypothetical protein [Bacillus cereus]|uniref:hypothetical protein n=1 Tax=Bacillus cereus TaxID=1396 RepID=UPI00240743A1|nr:hypothetical protein [Bacillus cereus]MCU5449450.1 hypothetical protein [Bacillus cereus]MDF9548411.1 hypothetical protein [Bacillus cereus]MDF9600610.1 hypothetical protein [Bacillus cereus]